MLRFKPLVCLQLFFTMFAGPIWADDGHYCIAAAQRAAQRHDVPVDVLIAITLTETGTRRSGDLQPWPWAVNTGGPSHWFDTRDEALAFAYAQFKAGKRNFDVGCFQLNFRWHSDAFESLNDMFDPALNADYAARFLKSHFAETKDWTKAAGRYHSLTEEYASRYRATFAAHRDSVRDGEVQVAAAQPPRRQPTPGGLNALAAPTGIRAAGSLVALGGSATPLLTQARSLFQ